MVQHSGAPFPELYGINHSNRSGPQLWGKNQFNSTFPTALACYMRDQGIPAVYLVLNEQLRVVAEEITITDLFNSDRPNDQLRFEFETRYTPYSAYALDEIDSVDLVVTHDADETDSRWRRPLEVKLTVVPDNTTARLAESEWSPELVVRPASTKYCALGIYDGCHEKRDRVREIFEDPCGTFQLWDSSHELESKRGRLLGSLDNFQREFKSVQRPFLMQPIWKTEGKSAFLSKNAFDLFVWSDFALCRAFIDRSRKDGINRCMRASARLARVLYELARGGKANFGAIYTQMAYLLQTDKEFALPGQVTKGYLNSPRRAAPALDREVVTKIVLNGGEKLLSPERRFDATVYFTAKAIFENV